MKHKELVEIGFKWLRKRCGAVFKEITTANRETPDVIGFMSGESILIEVKVSRSDFLRDKKKYHRGTSAKGMGRYRFYLCPEGLIKKEDLPYYWGLLWVNSKGKVEIIHNPYCRNPTGNIYSGGFDCDIEAEHRFMYSILRRMSVKGMIKHDEL